SGNLGGVYRFDPETNTMTADIELDEVLDDETITSGVHYTGGTVWIRYSYICDDAPCRQGVARIDPATNDVVAIAELPAGWINSGMSAGPTTAWTVGADAIARIDL
ncbi:MAG: hypothetical protein OES13_07435, partial [Acidimicrobiia bacterium]|nr:hypothetical protein [Acidimicrobiia bacterium]